MYVEYDEDGELLNSWTEEEFQELELEEGLTDEGTIITFDQSMLDVDFTVRSAYDMMEHNWRDDL